MKKLLTILFSLAFLATRAQPVPNFSMPNGYPKFINISKDTVDGFLRNYQNSGVGYYSKLRATDGPFWVKVADTAAMLAPYARIDGSNLFSTLAGWGLVPEVKFRVDTFKVATIWDIDSLHHLIGAGGVPDGDKGDIDVTSSGTVWTVDTGAVSNLKMANMTGPAIKGRTAGSGAPQDLSATQLTSIVNTFTPALSGTVPASGVSSQWLTIAADGNWRDPDRYNVKKVVIQAVDSTGGNTFYRMDGQSITSLSGDSLIMLGSWFYTTNTNDFGPCKIFKSYSKDRGHTWTVPVVAIPSTAINISTPSTYTKINGTLIAICNVKTIATGFTLASNLYLYKSTDRGATWTFIDSLIHGTNIYNYTSADRIIRSPQTGRLFLPYMNDVTPSISPTTFVGRYFYSDDDGDTWTEGGLSITSPDNIVNEAGIIVTKRYNNQSSGNSDQLLYFFNNSVGVDLYFSQSINNGTSFTTAYKSGLQVPYGQVSAKSIDGGTTIAVAHNRYRVGGTGQPDDRKLLDLSFSHDLGTTWTTEFKGLNGLDSGFHYFEPSIYYDSVFTQFIISLSRMEDNQHTGNAMVDLVSIPFGKQNKSFPPGRFSIAAGTPELSVDPLVLQIYNRDLGYTDSHIGIGSWSAAGNDFGPFIFTKSHPGNFQGLLLNSYMGADGITAYYSAALAINGKTAAGGTLTAANLIIAANNNVTKWSVGFNGKSYFAVDPGFTMTTSSPDSLYQPHVKAVMSAIGTAVAASLNANGGSGDRVLEPGPQTIKTLASDIGLKFDSATAHTLKINIDSLQFLTRAEGKHWLDSLRVAIGGSGVTDGNKGDITVSGSGATWTINNSAVTLAKTTGIAASGANTDITSMLLNQTGLVVKGGSANALTIKPNETLSAARTLNIVTGDASRTLTFTGDASITGTNTGDQTLGSLGAAASGANTDITSVLLNQTGLVVKGATSNALTIKPNETLTAGRTLNIVTGDADRTLTFTGNASITGTNTGDQTITLTSDVTGTGTGSFATTIANNAVTYAKMQDVSATQRVIGRNTAGAGDPEEVTASQVLDWRSSTQGAILYRGSSTWDALTGTNGQILQSSGASANPVYVNPDPTIVVAQTLGSELKGQTLGASYAIASSNYNWNNTSGVIKWTAVYLPVNATLFGVKFIMNTQGNYTADASNKIGLYTLSGTTLTRVAISNDSGGVWKFASGTVGKLAFTAPYTATAGVYWVAALYHFNTTHTTDPVIATVSQVNGASILDFTTNIKLTGTTTGATDLPSSQAMSGITVNNNYTWFGLY